MARPELVIIAALARNGVIGRDNALPWRLPEDLRHFKETTLGHPILMGRKTWESLGRPLPGRRNIVISRDAAYRADGAEVVAGIDDAIARCTGAARVFLIGGAELYRQALPHADRLLLTEIDAEFAGDAFFPPLAADAWIECERQAAVSAGGLHYAFVTYRRR